VNLLAIRLPERTKPLALSVPCEASAWLGLAFPLSGLSSEREHICIISRLSSAFLRLATNYVSLS
jgi:hypothetical protein